MKRLKVTEEFRAYSEEEAIAALSAARERQNEGKYVLGANGYKYKTKKAKGEIIGEAWVVSITKIYDDVWDKGEFDG
jgi:hypothetical protein